MRTIAPVRCNTLAAIYYIYHMKYKSSDSQGEILPNLLKLKSLAKINESEFEGFLKAEIYFTENLNSRIKFSKTYILKLHKLALQQLYSFAGNFALWICLKEVSLLLQRNFYQKQWLLLKMKFCLNYQMHKRVASN